MTELANPAPGPLRVSCLCAQWCDTCNAYAPLFRSLRASFAQVRFDWIDIEDEAELVDPLEVDNFPSILISRDEQALFFGTVTPHLETLRRLIQAHLDGAGSPTADPQAQALAVRLAQFSAD